VYPVQIKDIPKNSTFTTTLTELKKFVQYSIQVLAYSRLGDGVLSTPITRVQTFEDGKNILQKNLKYIYKNTILKSINL